MVGRTPAQMGHVGKEREIGKGGGRGNQRTSLDHTVSLRLTGVGAVGTHTEKADTGTCPLLPYLSGKVHILEFG